MKEQLLEYLFKKLPIALSYHKVIFNEESFPYDCEFLDVNNIYENLIGLKDYEIIGNKFSDIYGVENNVADKLIEAYQEAIINEKTVVIDLYNKKVLKWLRITIFILEKGYFASIVTDVTKQYIKDEKIDGIYIDKVTGLMSFDFFYKRINEEIERSDKYNDQLSMLIFEVDNLKNENLDNSLKEQVIKKIAMLTSGVIRKYDTLVRVEDQKFILLMPKTNINGAVAVAEKIQKRINENVHPILGQFNASFGVAEKIKTESLLQWYEKLKNALNNSEEKSENYITVFKEEEELYIKREKMEWNSEWESGNVEIDNQHKKMLEILNKLVDEMIMVNNYETCMRLLDVLINDIIKHFNYEEGILLAKGYKDYDRHCKIHKNLVGKVFQLKQSYENKELTSAKFFSFIVDDFMVGHIINEDKKFFNIV